jgi:threonine dehydrogenase-like Zn-dependent dehydrogenase
MRAAVAKGTSIDARDGVAEPIPGVGQVLVRTIACGICGSDLHALAFPQEMARVLRGSGAVCGLDAGVEYVMGHEFVAEILEHGPETEGALPVGSLVCSMPFATGPDGAELVGYSPTWPGGYGERMILQESALIPVPDGLEPRLAALTEPLAVGEHAVALADIQPGWPCHVVGCGPIGLAVIVALQARGVGPISASDFSPVRRKLAKQLGADVVLDPAEGSGFPDFTALGIPSSPFERAAAAGVGAEPSRAVVFEAVGVPGVINAISEAIPPATRIVVAGVCMQTDRIEPAIALVKELELRFAFAYSAAEFATTLARIARAPEVVAPLITGSVGVDGVARAFTALRAGEQVKVIIEH